MAAANRPVALQAHIIPAGFTILDASDDNFLPVARDQCKRAGCGAYSRDRDEPSGEPDSCLYRIGCTECKDKTVENYPKVLVKKCPQN